MYKPKLLSRILNILSLEIADQECGLDDDEIEQLVEQLDEQHCGLNDDTLKYVAEKYKDLPKEEKIGLIESFVDKKLCIEKICERYGITRMTLNRWQAKGKLPQFHHDGGDKSYLFRSECDEYIERWNKEHPEFS